MIKIKIEVTGEDIADGQPNNCRECPVAIAARRAVTMPGLVVYVAQKRRWRRARLQLVIDEQIMDTIPLSFRASIFITYFDNFGPNSFLVRPFSFFINIERRKRWTHLI